MTIKLNAATGGGSVSLSAPNSTTSNLDVELTLPVDDGAANTFLKSDGAGTLSWASASSDNITEGNTTVECVDTGSDGHITFDCDGSEKMRIVNSGRVYINTTSSTDFIDDGSKFYVRNSGQCMAIYNDTGSGWNVRHRATNNGGTYYFISFNAGTTGVGGITSNGSTTTYGTTSDYRLKENVEPIAGAVDRLKQLNPCRFNFIAAPEHTVDGFLAHEAQAVVPEAVVGVKDEVEAWNENDELPEGVAAGDTKLDADGNTIPVYQNIDQSKLVPLLTAALQEAIGKIEALETANASLEARLTALEGGAS